MEFAEFERRVREHGLVARDCGEGHWRIEGGKFTVNWWPYSRRKTVYVDGLSKSQQNVKGDFETVLKLATKHPRRKKSKSVRKRSYKRAKKRLFKKHKHCYWCKCELTVEKATVDHVIPLSRGGSDGDNNLVISCQECNHAKGSKVWGSKGGLNANSSNLDKRQPDSSQERGQQNEDQRQGPSEVPDGQWGGYMARSLRRCGRFIKETFRLN